MSQENACHQFFFLLILFNIQNSSFSSCVCAFFPLFLFPKNFEFRVEWLHLHLTIEGLLQGELLVSEWVSERVFQEFKEMLKEKEL